MNWSEEEEEMARKLAGLPTLPPQLQPPPPPLWLHSWGRCRCCAQLAEPSDARGVEEGVVAEVVVVVVV